MDAARLTTLVADMLGEDERQPKDFEEIEARVREQGRLSGRFSREGASSYLLEEHLTDEEFIEVWLEYNRACDELEA